jgi:hypothetical protein
LKKIKEVVGGSMNGFKSSFAYFRQQKYPKDSQMAKSITFFKFQKRQL